MKFKMELLILPIVILFIYFRPRFLVNFSSTPLGKFLMLCLIVLATLKNKWYGLSAVVLSIIVTEMSIIEGMDFMKDMNIDEKAKDMTSSIGEMKEKIAVPTYPGNDEATQLSKQLTESLIDNINNAQGDVNIETDDDKDSDETKEDEEAFTLINNFGITGGNERLYMDEKLRSKNSNDCIH